MVHVHLAGFRKPGSEGVTHTVERPEVLGKPCQFPNLSTRLGINPLLPTSAREDIRAVCPKPLLVLEGVVGEVIHDSDFILPRLGVPDVDNTIAEIEVVPFQLEYLTFLSRFLL